MKGLTSARAVLSPAVRHCSFVWVKPFQLCLGVSTACLTDFDCYTPLTSGKGRPAELSLSANRGIRNVEKNIFFPLSPCTYSVLSRVRRFLLLKAPFGGKGIYSMYLHNKAYGCVHNFEGMMCNRVLIGIGNTHRADDRMGVWLMLTNNFLHRLPLDFWR